jgi:Fe2+ transport system protein B
MSRKQYLPPAKTHEGKNTRKKEKEELAKQQAEFQAQQELVEQPVEQETTVIPTEEDKAQLRKLIIFSSVGIGLLLFVMYYLFVSGN